MSFLEHLHQLLYVTILCQRECHKVHSAGCGANIQMYAYLSSLKQLLYQIHASFFRHLSLPYYLIQCYLVTYLV